MTDQLSRSFNFVEEVVAKGCLQGPEAGETEEADWLLANRR